MFTKDIGIDLGTANTLVYMKGRGIIMREPSVVAVDPRSDELRVRSVGHEAKAVIGRAPGSIVAVRPLKDGVIADFDITAAMLQSFIRQACGNSILAHPRVVICVPSGVTEVERRAVRQAAAKAGARQVTVIEEPMAAAIGAGLPKDILIRSEEVREAMSESLLRIVDAIKDTLECTPPELSSDIIDRGIMLSGGGALLRGLDTLIQNETGIDVHIAEAPLDCVALGAGAVLDNPDLAGKRREEMSYL